LDLTGEEVPDDPVEGFSIPGCGDKFEVDNKEILMLNVGCVDNASVIPSSVFSSNGNKVYNTFYSGALNNHNQLQWMADVFGNLTGNSPPKLKMKRRSSFFKKRDDNPDQFTNWQFKLDWVLNNPSNPKDCFLNCPRAFATLAATPQCSQKGDGKNLMSMAGQINVGCGMYGYTVKGIAIS
jgi:hypothetical protein